MATIVIGSSQELTSSDLKIIDGVKKANVVASGQSIIESDAVTITNLAAAGVDKKTAARVIASRMVEAKLAAGEEISDISWQGPSGE